MTTQSNEFLNAALRYAELGYRVFPCVPGTKVPLTLHGFYDATTDPGIIEAWWKRWPNANVGIPTEGLLVVDVDSPDNPWLKDDPEKLQSLAVGAVSDSPAGGAHHLFRQPAGRAWRCTVKSLAPKVDTRANGGLFLVAPSVINGKAYRWRPTLELQDRPDQLPEPPSWLVALLDELDQKTVAVAVGDANPIPDGHRNNALTSLAGSMRRVGMSQAELLAALERVNADRCQPPLPAKEVARIAQSVARYAPDEVSTALAENHYAQMCEKKAETIFTPALQLCKDHKTLRRPIIHGLLREGESMNVIAASKTGKSWLVLHLAMAVASGFEWLGYPCDEGNVLLIDNELHPETLANRIPRVSDALQLPPHAWKDRFFVRTLRGDLQDLYRMEEYFRALPPDFFRVIILDAFYRFLPKDSDENDNGTVANLYNLLDRCALYLNCAFVLIHHTSKGLQSGKSVTDVGAGAGSQSRAADAHLILRPHEEDNCLSVDAVARSWPPPTSFVIRHKFPLWELDPTLDPADLKKPERRSRRTNTDEPELPLPKKTNWTTDIFAERFLAEEPRTKADVIERASEEGLPDYRTEKLLKRCLDLGKVFRWRMGAGVPKRYGTVPQPPGTGDQNHGDATENFKEEESDE